MQKEISVNDILKKLESGVLESPMVLSDYVVQLSASLYRAGVFELDLEMNYLRKWEEVKDSEEMTDKKADARAKQTEEYRNWKKAVIANKTILETIRALKHKLRNLSEELASGQNF